MDSNRFRKGSAVPSKKVFTSLFFLLFILSKFVSRQNIYLVSSVGRAPDFYEKPLLSGGPGFEPLIE